MGVRVTLGEAGGGTVRLTAGALAAHGHRLRALVNGFAQVIVTPMRYPLSLERAGSTGVTGWFMSWPARISPVGGVLVGTREDADGVDLEVAGYAELLASSGGQIDWTWDEAFWSGTYSLEDWVLKIVAEGHESHQTPLATHHTVGPEPAIVYPSDDAPATMTLDGGYRSRLDVLDAVCSYFGVQWRIRLDAEAVPVLDVCPLDDLHDDTLPYLLFSRDLPSGPVSSMDPDTEGWRVINTALKVTEDVRDVPSSVLAIAGSDPVRSGTSGWPTTYPWRVAGQSMRRHRLIHADVELDDPDPAPYDSYTFWALSEAAARDLVQTQGGDAGVDVEISPADWTAIQPGQLVYAQDVSSGVFGDWPIAMDIGGRLVSPTQLRVVECTPPITEESGVYMYTSGGPDGHDYLVDLSEWVVPSPGSVRLSNAWRKPRLVEDFIGRQIGRRRG